MILYLGREAQRQKEPAMTKFEVGKSYQARWVTNYDLISTFEVVKRTAKFVTLLSKDDGSTKRVGVHEWSSVETCKPFGTYSMCLVLSADRPVEVAA